MSKSRQQRRVFFLFGLLLYLLAGPSVLAQADDMAAEQRNKETYRRIINQAFGGRDLTVLDPVLAPDFVSHTPDGDVDRQGLVAIVAAYHDAIPDLSLTPQIVIAQGDFVAARSIFAGTFENPFVTPAGTFQPTGQPVEYAIDIIQRYNDEGQVVEEWLAWDNLNVLTQFGVIPAAEGASAPAVPAFPDDAETATGDPAAEEANAAMLNRIAEEVFNAGNYDLLDELLAEDYRLHAPPGEFDRATAKALFQSLGNAMTDLEMTRPVIVTEGNWAAARTVVRGTFENDYVLPNSTLPPTGEPVVVEIVNFFRFDDQGRVVEEWAEWDNLAFLTQLGAIGGAAEATPEATASS